MHPGIIYKITTHKAWETACVQGVFTGAAVDVADGFIHFSTAAQLAETARRHFHAQPDLALVAIDVAKLASEALKWEPSRGGALFPHLYAPLPTQAALWVKLLALNPDGVPEIPPLV